MNLETNLKILKSFRWCSVMTKIIRKLCLAGGSLFLVLNGSYVAASSEKVETSAVIVEKSRSELDLKNSILSQDLAECKELQGQQVARIKQLEEKIDQLDDFNKMIQGLNNDQIAVLKEDNEKLLKLNLRLERDSKAAARNIKTSRDQKTALLVETRLEKKALIKQIKDLEAKKTALKAENEHFAKLNSKLKEKSKEFFLRSNAVDYKVKNYDALSHVTQKLNREVVLLKKEKSDLKSQLDTIKKDLSTERASIYREVGAAAAQAGLVDESINAYQLSLSLDPGDAMTHYYLGLLYSKQWNDAVALGHFKKYLALAPMAENRKEVEYFMSIMLNRSDLVIK